MAGKKGIVPNHVKHKHFIHPGAEDSLIKMLETVEDTQTFSLFPLFPNQCTVHDPGGNNMRSQRLAQSGRYVRSDV
jgi:hypothetical protein